MRVATLIVFAALTLACSGEPTPPPVEPAPDVSAAPPDVGAPSSGEGDATPSVSLLAPTAEPALPPGHPPIDSAVPAAPAPAEGSMDLMWDTPSGWQAQRPASSMRRAQYGVPGSDGPGECVVFYFGSGQGGDPESNAMRWAQQFSQPDGRDSAELMATERLQVGDLSVLTVEITGTYTNRMVSNESKPGHMLLGAIVSGPRLDGGWFFKFTGPQGTVEEQRTAFDGLVQSLRAGG